MPHTISARIFVIFFLGLCATGCVTTEYWLQDGVSLKKTAADLSDCRHEANQGGQKVFSARELESPCMVAKGYRLSPIPPSP